MRTIWITDYFDKGIDCAYDYRGDAINAARKEYLDYAAKRLEQDENYIKAVNLVEDLRRLEEDDFIEEFVWITEIVLEPDSRYDAKMCCKEAIEKI